ncbi:MAG: glycosyltransferase [Candidatus Obscuribacterales bacterium]|nr:glycosyltransferase [Candidatus Obscuribacterales bacterium]
MHETNELISIIMATKNAARYLEQALESAALQTYQHYEIVLIDAQSSDRTLEIAQKYPSLRCYQQNSVGFANAWNEGIDLAKGKFIAFLDSDDRWVPDKLAVQFTYLQEHPECTCVVGHVQFFHDGDEPLPPSCRKDLESGPRIAYMPGALLARREVFDKIGKFDSTMTIASDIDWFARLKDLNDGIGVINSVVIEKRIHAKNLSYTNTEGGAYDKEILVSLRRSILRQRACEAKSTNEQTSET